MVTLSGGHRVGVSHCNAFQSRLTNSDPNLDPTYAATLRTRCPTAGSNNAVNLDPTTPTNLDETYYKSLQAKKGLLDHLSQESTERHQSMVSANTNFSTFGPKFKDAMIAMENIHVLTGTAGNIRLNCRKHNP